MLAEIWLACLLWGLVTIGLAWPIAARLPFSPSERWLATLCLSLLAIYLLAFGWYLTGWESKWLWLLPAVSTLNLIYCWSDFRALWRDRFTAEVVISQSIVSLWTLVWLAMVVSYSGAAWGGDWLEHWERSLFFIDHWPLNTTFIRLYSLPARPPMINLVTGVFMALTSKQFPVDQTLMCLMGSFVFTPAALLARAFGGISRWTIPALALLLMVNPMFVQNATYVWTKLPTAFLILSALFFYLRGIGPTKSAAAMLLAVICLAASLVAHYSAGPYAVVLALFWLLLNRPRFADATFWRQTAGLGIAGAAILATWFTWSLVHYGARVTLLSNTTMTPSNEVSSQWTKIAGNIVDTLVPPSLRSENEYSRLLLEQRSGIGHLRDLFFIHYQLNLLVALGLGTGCALVVLLIRTRRSSSRSARRFWFGFVFLTITLGIAVHGDRDYWGLAHICLQPVILVALAFVAAHVEKLSRAWRTLLIIGGAVDLGFGIVLHFFVQGFYFDRWWYPERSWTEAVNQLDTSAQLNLSRKTYYTASFLSDVIHPPPFLLLILLVALFSLALLRLRQACSVLTTSRP